MTVTGRSSRCSSRSPFVTGLVDAASYLKLGHVFVANMTGNVVFLGFALAGASGLSATSSLLALASFLLARCSAGGSALTTTVIGAICCARRAPCRRC